MTNTSDCRTELKEFIESIGYVALSFMRHIRNLVVTHDDGMMLIDTMTVFITNMMSKNMVNT